MNNIDYINEKINELQQHIKESMHSSNKLCDNRYIESLKDIKTAEDNIKIFHSELKSLIDKAKKAKRNLGVALLEIQPYLGIDVLTKRLDSLNAEEEKQRKKIKLLQNKAERLKKKHRELKIRAKEPTGLIQKMLSDIDNIALLEIKKNTPEYQCQQSLIQAAMKYREHNKRS